MTGTYMYVATVGADGSSREAIRDGGLWKFLTVRQIYLVSYQRKNIAKLS